MGLAALIVIGIISSIANPPKDEPTATSTTSSAPSTSKATTKSSSKATTKVATSAPATTAAKQGPGLGDEVRDGKFSFVVHSVKCGAKSLGGGFAKAQGQFCLVNMTVKNIGDEAQTMFSSNQYAYKGDTKYDVDDAATVAASVDSDDPWINDINPGNSLRGVIVFDVPKGTQLTKLELHDSAFSGGTEVFL
jgi:hypothetical protein